MLRMQVMAATAAAACIAQGPVSDATSSMGDSVSHCTRLGHDVACIERNSESSRDISRWAHMFLFQTQHLYQRHKLSAFGYACRSPPSLPQPYRSFNSAPVHTCAKFSYLSSERITKMQHSGLINLGVVIILATNSRLILENITKYGLRATPLTWLQRAISVSTSSNRHTLLGFVGLLSCVLAAWLIEVFGKKRLACVPSLDLSLLEDKGTMLMRKRIHTHTHTHTFIL
jgi:hypothetical protein